MHIVAGELCGCPSRTGAPLKAASRGKQTTSGGEARKGDLAVQVDTLGVGVNSGGHSEFGAGDLLEKKQVQNGVQV